MRAGDTFLLPDFDDQLWAVVSDPAIDAENVVVVLFVSWTDKYDQACARTLLKTRRRQWAAVGRWSGRHSASRWRGHDRRRRRIRIGMTVPPMASAAAVDYDDGAVASAVAAATSKASACETRTDSAKAATSQATMETSAAHAASVKTSPAEAASMTTPEAASTMSAATATVSAATTTSTS